MRSFEETATVNTVNLSTPCEGINWSNGRYTTICIVTRRRSHLCLSLCHAWPSLLLRYVPSNLDQKKIVIILLCYSRLSIRWLVVNVQSYYSSGSDLCSLDEFIQDWSLCESLASDVLNIWKHHFAGWPNNYIVKGSLQILFVWETNNALWMSWFIHFMSFLNLHRVTRWYASSSTRVKKYSCMDTERRQGDTAEGASLISGGIKD